MWVLKVKARTGLYFLPYMEQKNQGDTGLLKEVLVKARGSECRKEEWWLRRQHREEVSAFLE